jgi:predicted CXXCH cytochrome family protein
MISASKIKLALMGVFAVTLVVWMTMSTLPPGAVADTASEDLTEMAQYVPLAGSSDDYVGSDTCMACHEDQGKHFLATKHAKLSGLKGWEGKPQGCESCHGPGKAHVEESDPTKIISFKNKTSKEISETCLACHSGKEGHNNFRRGEHWRNNVGCTECHSSHGPAPATTGIGSGRFVGPASSFDPPPAMLKANEQQLCIACHSEVKAHFNKPFRHKVMEGAMKCSDCHNAHGGFESKQAKLGIGADASCVKCHSDKQGPFVFEHAPVKTEGCAACHTPHGSANPRLLKRHQVRQLCIECHSGITAQFADGPTGGPHDQKTLLQRNCTSCHTMIHGSNSSSVFFR